MTASTVSPITQAPRIVYERSPTEQAAYEAGVEAAKEAMGVELLGIELDKGDPIRTFFEGASCTLADHLEAAIDAACLPKPEPSIVVTEEMAAAGLKALAHGSAIGEIYRAMRPLEPAPEVTEAMVAAGNAAHHASRRMNTGYNRETLKNIFKAMMEAR